MWTATIQEKNFKQGTAFINVGFSNGTESFSEVFEMRRGADLNGNITSRLAQLEDTQTFVDTLNLGAYTVPAIAKAEELPLQKLQRLQQLVTLGVIKDTDDEVIQAIVAVKNTL